MSWWPGDGHAFDIVGENNGNLENGATYALGMVGQAFSFDGTDDMVTFSASEIGQLQQLTIELWIKLNTLRPDRAQRFVTIENEKAVLCIDLGEFHFYMRIDGELRYIWVANLLKAGAFHHIAGTYDMQVMRLYFDGVQVGSLKISGVIAYGGYGGFSNPDVETLDGLLDEVGIYNCALTASEIQEIHKAGSSGKCKLATITGGVTDTETGNPVGGATVTVDSGQVTTDSGGSFSLSVKAGTYTLTVTQKGYKTSTNPVTVDPGITKNIPMIISSAGVPILTIAVSVGGIVVAAVMVFLRMRKPVERVPKPYTLRITAEPTKLPADGRSTSNIVIELLNEEGDPTKATEDMKVILSTSTGSITSLMTISKGETTVNTTLRSSLKSGDVKVLAESKGLKGAGISLAFTEKKRYCMHCGA